MIRMTRVRVDDQVGILDAPDLTVHSLAHIESTNWPFAGCNKINAPVQNGRCCQAQARQPIFSLMRQGSAQSLYKEVRHEDNG